MKYSFHGKFSEKDKNLFKSSQEEDLIEICNYLQTPISSVKQIKFEIFDTREGKQKTDPNHSISRASARFNEMTVYRFWFSTDDPHFPHELTHLVAHTWVKPYLWEAVLDTWNEKKIKRKVEMVSTSFMQEGLAIAIDDIIFKRKLFEDGVYKFIDEWCEEWFDKNSPSLIQVINMEGFCNFENKIVVPFAASFSKFLLKAFGLIKYKRMYTKIKETYSAKKNIDILEDIYKVKESELFDRWKESLRNQS